MPNDYVTLKALAAELNEVLTDGRIDRVNMPSEHDVLLLCRAKGKNHTLLLRALAGLPRFYLSEKKYEAPLTPPNFCMILRKYLSGAKITGAGMLNGDRIFYLDVLTRNELNDLNTFRLVFELITTKPNILLLNSDGMILDTLKRNAETGVFPRCPYRAPQGVKISVEAVDATAFSDPEAFYRNVSEACFGLSAESLAELKWQLQNNSISVAWDTVLNQYSHIDPIIVEQKKGMMHFAYPYQSLADSVAETTVHYSSLSGAIESVDGASAAKDYKQKSTAHLNKTLKKLRQRLARRLDDHARRLQDGADKESYLQAGELLKCNFYRIERGMQELEVEDYYNGGTRKISLNPLLSPAENAERYFKIYLKKKGGEAYARSEEDRLNEMKTYLDTIEESIAISETEREYAEIEAELNELLGNKNAKPVKKQPKNRPSAPLRFLRGGCEIYVGRNNHQNQEVTFRIASSDDLWLHAKDYHGSHVIVKGKPDDETLLYAASLAAYYSGGRDSDKVQVDCAKRKYVKSLHQPGMVTYRNQTSYLVAPRAPEPTSV